MSISVLGYKLTTNKFSTRHINSIIAKAKINLKKLYRFNNAPLKIKKTLYKTLIRPLIEYPSIPLALTSKTNLVKIQRIQNAALRYVSGTKRRDRVKMSKLHEDLKMLPMNVRLHSLAKKCISKIIDKYSPNIEVNPINTYKYSDYTITDEPLRKRRRTMLQRINKYISGNKKCSLYRLNNSVKWPIPESIFT